ncbi:phosphohistidine phosphatase SixA [Pseudoalteromonas sp. OOF1S-7]|uniref:phosphohistidine phosphatase SixA n=1 Tax=Pseudoalteromonas sp. OOF1S-7 TaxID=2917757 RepID=UPI001EF708BC|nr:phosphohistidine phosphatase SixA [Pseudoalteromonas sp. OOF1S-7]MCG7533862.1 phosphohistidine phosphatase SixA [Pseudoalteromonas sp. OOF1S-7]
MKTILIMRHGEAGPMQANDAARALTSRGHTQAVEMGQWLAEHYPPQAVLVSPYIRAQQTAQAVLQNNSVLFEQTCQDIVPSGNAAVAVDYLETLISMHDTLDTWLVVAHMPIVSYLVDQLVPGEMPIFATASVAVIQYDPKTLKSDLVQLAKPTS